MYHNEQVNQIVAFTGLETAEVLQQAADTTPLAAQMLAGRTVCSLISPGTEVAGFSGRYWWTNEYPIIPGYAAVIEVTDVGPEVNDLQPGDLVLAMKPHQSLQRCTRAEVIPLPKGLDPRLAPFARLMAVTMSTLTTTMARPPETVLITGLGIIGHLAAQNFAACGYQVIACDPAPARQAIATRQGIHHVRASVPLDDPTLTDKVALVIDCSGHEQAVLDGCKIVKKRGEVVSTATPWQRRTELYAHELLHTIFTRYVVLRSGWEWELPLQATDFRTNSIYGNLTAAMQWIAEGRVNVTGLAALAPPDQANAAYRELQGQPAQHLTTLFDWGL